MTQSGICCKLYIVINQRKEIKMQIIKISPKSFKIILTKDDLTLSGMENTYDYLGFSKEFFAKVIDEANEKYGADFGCGVIDAEFFEDKYGGGELFLHEAHALSSTNAYAFYAQQSEILIRLCKRLGKGVSDSTLYCGDNIYILMLFLCDGSDFLQATIKEFGTLKKLSDFGVWEIQEHSRILIKDSAIEILASM